MEMYVWPVLRLVHVVRVLVDSFAAFIVVGERKTVDRAITNTRRKIFCTVKNLLRRKDLKYHLVHPLQEAFF